MNTKNKTIKEKAQDVKDYTSKLLKDIAIDMDDGKPINADSVRREGAVIISADAGRDIMKPCPFCGSPAEMCETITGFYCRCTNHECETMQTECDERPEALEAWNRRRSSHEDYYACVRKILKFDAAKEANNGK